jgi:hypothetical protein
MSRRLTASPGPSARRFVHGLLVRGLLVRGPILTPGRLSARGMFPSMVVLTLALLWSVSTGPARADAPTVFVAGGDSLSLWVLVHWDRPLPAFVEERLERGLPATVGVRAELVRPRAGWSDAKLAAESLEMQVAKDPWDGSYVLLDTRSARGLDSLAAVRATLSRQKLRLALQPEWCDGTSIYRVDVATFVAPLTARDAGEVDSWLRGQLRGLGRGLFGIPRGLFGVIRDLSGLGERTAAGESDRFRIEAISGGRVRALIPVKEGTNAEPVPPAEGMSAP